jgi:hypothetical protein
MRQFVLRHVDRILIAIGLTALILLSARTLHNLSVISATDAPQELRLEGSELTALYTLNSGMNKPAILNARGDALVEFSGWDSYVTVDGVTTDLWSHAFNIELDRARDRAFMTWSSVPVRRDQSSPERLRKYQIQQVLILRGNQADVEYYVIPNEPVHTVTLTIGVYKWYMRDFQRVGNMFSFIAPNLTRTEAEQHMQPRRVALVTIRPLIAPESVHPMINQYGTYAVNFSFRVITPRTYERTPIAIFFIAVDGAAYSSTR